MKYKLEKDIWTQDDFKVMGWHDCSVYAIQLADAVYLDLDYIFEWVLNEDENTYNFWVAPVTLQFISPYNLEISVKLDFVNGLEIADIHQSPIGNGLYDYHIETQEGDIKFTSHGYRQFVRKKPVLQQSQCLSSKDRDGYALQMGKT